MRESGQRNYTIGDLTYAISHNEGLEEIKKIVAGIRIADLDKRSHNGVTPL